MWSCQGEEGSSHGIVANLADLNKLGASNVLGGRVRGSQAAADTGALTSGRNTRFH